MNEGIGRRRTGWVGAALIALAVGPGPSLAAAAPARGRVPARLRAIIHGADIPGSAHRQFVVEQDLDQPDMALLTLGGPAGLAFAAGVTAGDDVQIEAEPASGGSLFKGEVVGIEPVFDPLNPSVVIRAYNRSHRLAREAQSKTYQDMSDQDIVSAVAAAHGLVPSVGEELTERYDLVYQHNQTDLEFLQGRAARIGYQVWCEDTTLFFRRVPAPPSIVIGNTRARGEVPLRRLHARLATSDTVQRLVARGEDPAGRRFAAAASAATLLLRPEPNTPAVLLGRTSAFTVDHPIFSVEEARAVAQAGLDALLAPRVDAEVETAGSDALWPGRVVVVRGTNDRFNGKYLVQGTSHRYSGADSCGGGYATLLKVRRATAALFFLPEINDDVLVAFEQGDLGRPYVVGSLWGSDDDDCSRDDPDRP
jgi:phage protein D